jgi:hypothetical protein
MAKDDDELVQSAVRLPRSLLKRLRAVGGERGMGTEIRRRVEWSFEAEAQPATLDFVNLVSRFAADLENHYGSWRTDPFAFEVFKLGVELLLERAKPKGDPVPHPNPNSLADEFFEEAVSPVDVAKMFVGWSLLHNQKRG